MCTQVNTESCENYEVHTILLFLFQYTMRSFVYFMHTLHTALQWAL